MAKYTITMMEMVKAKIPIFDFDYPIFNPNYKPLLEEKIINHFYFYEIGMETIGAFKFRLKEKLNLIMPSMNKYYESELLEQRILDNYDVTETFTKETKGNSTSKSTSNSNSKSKFMDTPQSRVSVPMDGYTANITEGEGANTDTAESNGNGVENWTRTMKGNIGVQTDADAINKYRTTILNVDEMVLKELEELFMGVW